MKIVDALVLLVADSRELIRLNEDELQLVKDVLYGKAQEIRKGRLLRLAGADSSTRVRDALAQAERRCDIANENLDYARRLMVSILADESVPAAKPEAFPIGGDSPTIVQGHQ